MEQIGFVCIRKNKYNVKRLKAIAAVNLFHVWWEI